MASGGGGPDILTILVPVGVVVGVLVILTIVGCCCWLSRQKPSEEDIAREQQRVRRSGSTGSSRGRPRAGSNSSSGRGGRRKKKKKGTNFVKSLSAALKFENSIYYSEGSRTLNSTSGARVSFNTRRPRKGSTANSTHSSALGHDGESQVSGASSQPRSILKNRNEGSLASSDAGSNMDAASLASGAVFGNGSTVSYSAEGGTRKKKAVPNGGASASVSYTNEAGKHGPPARGAAINFEPEGPKKRDRVLKHSKQEAYANTMADEKERQTADDESRAYKPSGGDASDKKSYTGSYSSSRGNEYDSAPRHRGDSQDSSRGRDRDAGYRDRDSGHRDRDSGHRERDSGGHRGRDSQEASRGRDSYDSSRGRDGHDGSRSRGEHGPSSSSHRRDRSRSPRASRRSPRVPRRTRERASEDNRSTDDGLSLEGGYGVPQYSSV